VNIQDLARLFRGEGDEGSAAPHDASAPPRAARS